MTFLHTLKVDSRQKPLITFDAPPPLGFVLQIEWHRRGALQSLTLEAVNAHVRRDGVETFVLTWRDQRGVEYKSGLRGQLQKQYPKLIDFAAPPPVGFRLNKNPKGEALARPLTLVKVAPYTRKTDGGASFLLDWQDDEGAVYRSGMRGPYPRPVTGNADH